MKKTQQKINDKMHCNKTFKQNKTTFIYAFIYYTHIYTFIYYAHRVLWKLLQISEISVGEQHDSI